MTKQTSPRVTQIENDVLEFLNHQPSKFAQLKAHIFLDMCSSLMN